MSTERPPGAEPSSWERALAIVRSAAQGEPGYGREASQAAIAFLGLIGDTDRLVDVARGEEPTRAALATAALVTKSPSRADPEVALAAARHGEPDVRIAGAAAVGSILARHPELAGALGALASDEDHRVRAAALGAVGSAARGVTDDARLGLLIGLLTDGLEDPDERVRAAAVLPFGWIPPLAGAVLTGKLVAMLADPEPGVRARVMNVLAGARVELPRLRVFLEATEPVVRARAAALLASVRSEAGPAKSVLTALLTSELPAERTAALEALSGRAGSFDREGAGALGDALARSLGSGEPRHTYLAAVSILALRVRTHRDAALAALRPLAESEERISVAAARALSREGEPAGDAALARLSARHPKPSVRRIAITALARVRTDDVLPWLARAMRDSSDVVRVAAATGLMRALRRP